MKVTFYEFCDAAKKGSTTCTDKTLKRICTDCKIYCKGFDQNRCDIQFRKHIGNAKKDCDYEDFLRFIEGPMAEAYAQARGIEQQAAVNELQAKIISGGPSAHGATKVSKDDSTARLTDVSGYTGSHKERFDVENAVLTHLTAIKQSLRLSTTDSLSVLDRKAPSGNKRRSTISAKTPPTICTSPPVSAVDFDSTPPCVFPLPTLCEPYEVQTLYDFHAEEDNELSFKAGEVVLVTNDSNAHWWQGTGLGGVGLFPSNLVTVLARKITAAETLKEMESVQLSQVSEPPPSRIQCDPSDDPRQTTVTDAACTATTSAILPVSYTHLTLPTIYSV